MAIEIQCPHCGDLHYEERDPEWFTDSDNKVDECGQCFKELYREGLIK